MSTAKILTGVSIVALLCGVTYQYRRASELELRLAEVRSDHATSSRQLRNLEREIAALKARPAASERASTGTASALPLTPSSESAPAAPPPGVTPKALRWTATGQVAEQQSAG